MIINKNNPAVAIFFFTFIYLIFNYEGKVCVYMNMEYLINLIFVHYSLHQTVFATLANIIIHMEGGKHLIYVKAH